MAQTKNRSKPIILNFRSEQTVVVVPENEDRFGITVREAARACQFVQSVTDWRKEFDRFLSHIHEWSERHSEWVDATYVNAGEVGLRVEVCTNKEDYDFEIDDEITDFDIELSEKFPMCPAEVTQIPNQAHVQAGLVSDTSMVVYGDASRTRDTGKT